MPPSHCDVPCWTSIAPICPKSRSASRSMRSSSRPSHLKRTHGNISGRARSATNACAACNTTGCAPQCSSRRPATSSRADISSRSSAGSKCLGDKGWRSLERDGLEKAYPQYAAQVSLYQAYLDVTEHPAIFTAVNGNTCARLHLLVPFNAEQAQVWSDRAVAVIEATRAGELLPRAYDDPADWRCKACGHHERCWNRP